MHDEKRPAEIGGAFLARSAHNLAVAAGKFSTSFAVDVQQTAPTPAVAPITRTNTGVRLAYTGMDATSTLSWALGLLFAAKHSADGLHRPPPAPHSGGASCCLFVGRALRQEGASTPAETFREASLSDLR